MADGSVGVVDQKLGGVGGCVLLGCCCSSRRLRPHWWGRSGGQGTPGQRHRRTFRRQHPPRTPRPHPDHQPASRGDGASRVRAVLQQPSAAPRPWPSRSATTAPSPDNNRNQQRPPTRPTRRIDPRVSAGGMRCAEFRAPTRRSLKGRSAHRAAAAGRSPGQRTGPAGRCRSVSWPATRPYSTGSPTGAGPTA